MQHTGQSREHLADIQRQDGLKKKASTRATLLNRIGGSPPTDALDACNNMLDTTLDEPRSLGLFKKPMITATDDHDVVVHFKHLDEEYMTKGKPKNGTNKKFRYTTIMVVGRTSKFSVAVHPTGIKHAKEEILLEQIMQARKAGIISKRRLLDRGFASVGVINALKKTEQSFIMLMRWSKKVEKIVAAYDAKKGLGVLSYVMHGKNKTTATATLVITKRKDAKKTDRLKDRFLVFLTDVNKSSAKSIVANMPQIYKKRW